MNNFAAIDAAVLYDGKGGTPPAPATPTPPTRDTALAAKLYGPSKQPKVEMETSDDTSIEDRLYGDSDPTTNYEPALSDSLKVAYDMMHISDPAQQQEHTRNVSQLFADMQMPPQQAAQVYSLAITTMKKGPIDAATMKQWTHESRTQLRERYGEGADARLAKVQEFVRARPGLAQWMRSGLGSMPQIVLSLAEAVPNMRMTPRARKGS